MNCLSLWNPLSPDLPENFLISMGRAPLPKAPMSAFLQTEKFIKNPYFEPKKVEIMIPRLYNKMFFISFEKGRRGFILEPLTPEFEAFLESGRFFSSGRGSFPINGLRSYHPNEREKFHEFIMLGHNTGLQ
jgi:hypothetical protein